jgi:hypothetical protein
VVGHEVEHQLEAAAVDLRQQGVEVGECAEDGIDGAIVGDVVAEVGHGRDEDGREPYSVDAQRNQVIEALPDAGEVADAVAVCVLERPRVDLIDDAALPPG